MRLTVPFRTWRLWKHDGRFDQIKEPLARVGPLSLSAKWYEREAVREDDFGHFSISDDLLTVEVRNEGSSQIRKGEIAFRIFGHQPTSAIRQYPGQRQVEYFHRLAPGKTIQCIHTAFEQRSRRKDVARFEIEAITVDDVPLVMESPIAIWHRTEIGR